MHGSAEVLGVFWDWGAKLHKFYLPPLLMTSSDDYVQDAVPSQKLEWVTPKISLMEAGDTEGKIVASKETQFPGSGS
jgi:hypothetical protein